MKSVTALDVRNNLCQAEERRRELLAKARRMRTEAESAVDTVALLRQLRGYAAT